MTLCKSCGHEIALSEEGLEHRKEILLEKGKDSYVCGVINDEYLDCFCGCARPEPKKEERK